jgi:tetratricopeptide (TPR) repeat protein
VATNFKNQGNEYFVAKRYKEARNFYTQGVDAYPTDLKLQETLLTNRAACNLELENYGMTLKDCSQALGLNPQSSKAFYRSARALLALDRFIEAIDCCDHALLVDESNSAARQLRSRIVEKSAAAERREAESKERQRREQEGKVAIGKALLARGVWVEVSKNPPDNPNPAHFDPEALSPLSSASLPLLGDKKWTAPDSIRTPLIFPVFFLYPVHFQSDLISHFHEDTTIASHLDVMFPAEMQGSLPWDTKGEYVSSNLNVYATTKRKRLLKLGKKITLREILDKGARDADKDKGIERDGIVMMDGFISIVVLPKGEGEQKWIEHFKAERDAK